MSTLVRWVFPVIVLALIGNALWQQHLEKKDSLTWPETKGYLISAHLKEVSEENTDQNGLRHTDHYFTVEVNYDYHIDGNWYRSNRSKIGGQRFIQRDSAQQYLNQLQASKTLVVYYNPAAPGKSTLIR